MAESRELLELTAALAADYLESLPSRPVFPKVQPDELRAAFGGPLQDGPLDAPQVILGTGRRRGSRESSPPEAGATSGS